MGRILFLAKYSLYYYYSFSNDFDNGIQHGLRTPNIDINQRNLKFWVNVAKYALAIPINLGLELNFWPFNEDYFLYESVVRGMGQHFR